MKKNLIFFIGGVAVLGAGAYFFLRKKKTPTNSGASTSISTTTSTTNTPLSGVSSVEQIVDLAKNIEEARNLASSIKSKKDKISEFENKISRTKNTGAVSTFGFSVPQLTINGYRNQIQQLQSNINSELEKLKELGFTELNGNPIKIA